MPAQAPSSLTALDEALIETVIHAFYARVRKDPLIGPIFNARIAPDHWPQHLATIVDFWSSLLLGTKRYQGRPLAKHLVLEPLRDEHFLRWLSLFRTTVMEHVPEELAPAFIVRAERIANSFRMGIAFHHGEDTVSLRPLRAS
ncbi:group III truncated hemoglobin [Rhodoligotrophos ferricapiens]|uniref:group III truncated hemoglobin n=1 Tax=Rhodoligotrophos ferricapiens TaxID=3069264 RepID=UPI00315C5FEA